MSFGRTRSNALITSCTARGVRLIHDRLPDGTVPYGVAVHADSDDVLRAVARRHRATAMTWPALPADVAPTALEMIGLPQPDEMTGNSLLT